MQPQLSQSPHRTRRPRFRVLACVVLAAITGCSVRGYEERLEHTNELFGYMNMLNENLSAAAWGDTHGFGIRMRPPRPFVLVPPPPAPTEENPYPVDERYPHVRYPGFLPWISDVGGLIGSWETALETTDGDRGAFLLVFGNHERFIDQRTGEGGGEEPAEFLNDLKARLQRAVLGHTNPLPEANTGSQDNEWYPERIPQSPRSQVEDFPAPKDFSAISFLPPEERLEEFRGVPVRLQLFEYTPPDSNVQLAVLMIYPVNVLEDPVVRLRLALETLEMVEEPPRPQRTAEDAGESVF